jgi:hypothetical protein
MDRRQAVMLFMAMLGLLALPESDVEAEEIVDPDYDPEFGYADCREVVLSPNCPDRPYRYRGILVAQDGHREANASITIEEGGVIITGMFGDPVVIPALCNGSIDFVDQMAQALDGIAGTSSEREAAHKAFIGNEIVEDGPLPTSNREWGGEWHLFGLDDELPVRNASVETRFAYDGHSITMDVLQPPDPAWIDGIEQPYKSLGSFLLVGNAARFLDGISSIADADWLKEKERWLQKPFTFCPSCLGSNDRRPWCERCKGRAFIDVDASEAEQHVAEEKAKRQAMIDAANVPIRAIRKKAA